MNRRQTPPTNAIAMARWAWDDIAELRVTIPPAQCSLWEVCESSEKSISRRWEEEHKAKYPGEGKTIRGLLSQRRAHRWGDALFAWRDAKLTQEYSRWAVTMQMEYVEFSRLKNHLTIADMWLKGDALHQAVAEMLLSFLAKREGATWEDVTATVLIHGNKAQKEAAMFGRIPRTERWRLHARHPYPGGAG